ncbi:MAG: 4Fe-4S dicluster domain-containing protein [Deltaproteobacteria bacterium]|nr:4Fe-4S dicluster domain-containing protein [Deltaproteobacteria bacterium]
MTEEHGKQKMRTAILVDASRCIGCFSCQAACAMEHDLPAGTRTVKVMQLGPFEQGDDLTSSFLPTTCFHCEKPACVAACPTGAMQKRADGTVISDGQTCIGCRTCAVACPYGIPVLNPATGKIAKCDGCSTRVELGLWPACVLKCPSAALAFGSTSRLVQERREREAIKTARVFWTP